MVVVVSGWADGGGSGDDGGGDGGGGGGGAGAGAGVRQEGGRGGNAGHSVWCGSPTLQATFVSSPVIQSPAACPLLLTRATRTHTLCQGLLGSTAVRRAWPSPRTEASPSLRTPRRSLLPCLATLATRLNPRGVCSLHNLYAMSPTCRNSDGVPPLFAQIIIVVGLLLVDVGRMLA
jgi:hypothetical protein